MVGWFSIAWWITLFPLGGSSLHFPRGIYEKNDWNMQSECRITTIFFIFLCAVKWWNSLKGWNWKHFIWKSMQTKSALWAFLHSRGRTKNWWRRFDCHNTRSFILPDISRNLVFSFENFNPTARKGRVPCMFSIRACLSFTHVVWKRNLYNVKLAHKDFTYELH